MFNLSISSLSVFEQYQKARTQFVQTVAELATRPQNIEILQNAGVMSLLRPLLLDIVPTIQQTAALALGRLANFNDDLAEAVVKGDILPQLVYSLAEQNVSRGLINKINEQHFNRYAWMRHRIVGYSVLYWILIA